jgi:undecaprenyl diphosphate synthase
VFIVNAIRHLGVIMDGNRRWAKGNGVQSFRGHDRGADVFVDTCDWCIQEGIDYLTVYAFSTENWKRPQVEVLHIFGLLERFFNEKISLCLERGIRITVIGERDRFDRRTMDIVENAEARTRGCKNLRVQIALSYGGRDEIVRAAKKLASDSVADNRLLESISEDLFASYLDTAGIPDVDLVVRTGGADNRRLSNFLPWQTVYAELYFSDLLWPDFSREEFEKCIAYYNAVKRNLGK